MATTRFLLSYSRLIDGSVAPSVCIFGSGFYRFERSYLGLYGDAEILGPNFHYVRLPGRQELFESPTRYHVGDPLSPVDLVICCESLNNLCATLADFALFCDTFSPLFLNQLNPWFLGAGDPRFETEDNQWEIDAHRIGNEFRSAFPELMARAGAINPKTRSHVEAEWYDSLTTIEYELLM